MAVEEFDPLGASGSLTGNYRTTAARESNSAMIADHLIGIQKFEADLWKVADDLRANSNLASNEYFMPVMGLIFLRHATNRFYEAKAAIEADKAADRVCILSSSHRRG
jgi:HsdM N-terminal domain